MSELGPGCVKTRTSRECAELFSLFSSFDGDCQSGSFLIQRNRDKLSTRKFDFGVFTQPGSKADLGMECAPGAGQVEVSDLTGVLGFRKMKAMARQQRSHSIEFKRQVVQEYIAGETLYGLAKRHDLSRQLIRVWVEKYEAGGLDADAQAADLLHEYETKIVALERMVGRQALEIEFLKGALKNAPRPRSATTSVIAGPTASPSQKDAG